MYSHMYIAKLAGLPEITSSVTVVTFDIGDTVLIPCEARGLPDPSVEWNWDSAITTATSSKSVLSNHSLLLSNLSMLDAGSYWCTARNSVGVAVQNVTLYFQQLPRELEVTCLIVVVYRIAGKFDGELNLANWRFWTATVKV